MLLLFTKQKMGQRCLNVKTSAITYCYLLSVFFFMEAKVYESLTGVQKHDTSLSL